MAKKKKAAATSRSTRPAKGSATRKKSASDQEVAEIYIHPDLSAQLDSIEAVDPKMADSIVRSILGKVNATKIKSVTILGHARSKKQDSESSSKHPWDKDCT